VIDYLPRNIPRILINRTIVHPPEPLDDDRSCSGNSDDEEQEDYDFRKNYVFDAYLLGNCDVVTRALGYDLFHTSARTDIHGNTDLEEAELLTTVLLKSENGNRGHSNYDAKEWANVRVPTERVFLFPGAQAPPSTGVVSEAISFREIAHCDGCAKQIEGTIQKCIVCFDYDLCRECFPILSKKHYNGVHDFTAEMVSS
jgi:hypothetical protein